jgi:hypothetical protein
MRQRSTTSLGYAYLESRTERSSYYVDEPITVALRFGFERQVFESKLVALFRPPMDLPVQLEAPWLEKLSGATLLARDPGADTAASGSATFVLNDQLTRAREVEAARADGRQFRVFEIERKLLAHGAGTLELPESRLRFAYATRWNEGFATDRVGADRVEAFVRAAARTLTILPLPEEGRPEGFSGAVGALVLRGEASAREIAFGSSLKIVLHVSGDGNLESFEPPRFEHIEGWRVNGVTDQKTQAERTFEIDLSPLSERVTRVPQIPFSFFDTTTPASYRTLRTEPIAIVVRPPAKPMDDPYSGPDERSPGRVLFACLAALALLLAIGLWIYLRRTRSALRP